MKVLLQSLSLSHFPEFPTIETILFVILQCVLFALSILKVVIFQENTISADCNVFF